MIHAKLVSFTDRGAQTAARAAAFLEGALTERYARATDPSLAHTLLERFTQQAMADCDLIVFVGAVGIAVRAVAPYLQGKSFDPAVLVIDEGGRYVIPILSGHLGGANAFAGRIAQGLGAQAVVTTATDGRGVFAVDSWAKAHGCTVMEVDRIKYISGALLRGETVGLRSAFAVDGRLPARMSLQAQADSGFVIGFDCGLQPFAHTLHVIPKIVHIGVGCRKGVSAHAIGRAVSQALEMENISMAAVCSVASIDLKKDEPGLLQFCREKGLPLKTYSAQTLQSVDGDFSASEFVRQTVGVDNVCERSAVCAAGNGCLLRRKMSAGGVTVALALEDWRACF